MQRREVVTVAVDWMAIRMDYINGGGSYRTLAEKYGVYLSVLGKKATAEGWKAAKDEHLNKIRAEAERKAIEKASNAMADQAAAKSRIEDKVFKMLERWLDKHADEAEDTGDIRRIVQSCVDMGMFNQISEDGAEDGATGVVEMPAVMPEPEVVEP